MVAQLTVAPHWTGMFAAALRGEPCRVHGLLAKPIRLQTAAWQSGADDSDLTLVRHCLGPTLDIGCGPGRMTEALALAGRQALGIDVVAEAVRQTRTRGVAALLRDVFGRLPAEGRWHCALLADGNIGIGGDAVALLRRVHGLLAEGGRVVADLAPHGSGLSTRSIRLECAGRRSGAFDWAVVGSESIEHLAAAAGFTVAAVHDRAGRCFAVLHKAAAPPILGHGGRRELSTRMPAKE